jgi:DNA-binding beta-propeller fold protein YncE
MRRALAVKRIALCAISLTAGFAAWMPSSSLAAARDVVAAGNAFAGTVSFLDGHTYRNLGSFNAVPDLAQRKLEIALNPVDELGYQMVKQQKGGENYIDDVVLSPDGKTLYVSRGILEDVAAFNISTGQMLWRTEIGGFEADHMAISPDGTQLAVSDLTDGLEKVFSSSTGQLLGSFPAGTYTHEVEYSPDGNRLYVGSIGITQLPYLSNSLKGARQVTIADAHTFQVIKTFQFQYGVRPDILTPDEKYYYFQQSYNRGFVEFDLATGQVTRSMTTMPATAAGDALFPDKLPANSMHHGLALSGDQKTICAAGTIDNYVALVDRSTFAITHIIPGMSKPYWAITSADGSDCLISNSEGNNIEAINYATGAVDAKTTVGWYPQRTRIGVLDSTAEASLSPSAG